MSKEMDKKSSGKIINNPNGAPKIQISDEMRSKIEYMAGIGMTTDQLAHMLDMSPDTLQSRMKEDPSINSAIEKGRAAALHNVMKSAYQQAVSGENTAMTIFYLKTRARWKETHVIEHTGKVELDEMSLDQKLDKLNKIMSLLEHDSGEDSSQK